MSGLRMTKVGAVLPIATDEDGRLLCPDLGCGEPMVEREPGVHVCPVTAATADLLAGMAARLEGRFEDLFA